MGIFDKAKDALSDHDSQVDGGIDTWRQWKLAWNATPGTHRIRVRATDAKGQMQPEERTDVAPDGATGWHEISVDVSN